MITTQNFKLITALSLLMALLPTTFIGAQIQKGYHGFVDVGYSINYSGTISTDWTELNTIHGYQVNSHFFIGGGVGMHYISDYKKAVIDGHPHWKRASSWEVPLFANFRYTILNKRVTPFIDVRMGYYVTHHSGQYVSPGFGCRFALKNNQSLYVQASLISTKFRYKESDMITRRDYSYSWYYKDIDESQEAVSIRVGYEF